MTIQSIKNPRLLSSLNLGTHADWHFYAVGWLAIDDDDVALYAAKLAEALGKKPKFCGCIRYAASFRDAGKKLAKKHGLVPVDSSLPLHRSVRQRITVESRLASKYLSSTTNPLMQMASDIATFSRERWDGRGFPDGLTADEIPEAARIVSVCVTYCSLTTTTSHGAHWQPDDALAYMDSQAGKRFDPSMVETFRHLLAPTKQTDMTTGGTLFRPAIP